MTILATGMAQGMVPVSMALSGRQMRVSVDKLSGHGFALYPGVVRSVDGRRHMVLQLAMRSARMYGLCQSTWVDTPFGRYVLRLATRDHRRPSYVSELGISATSLNADVNFGSLLLNQATGTLNRTLGQTDSGTDYGIGARDFTVREVKVGAWAVMGGSFQVNGLKVELGRDVPACF
ncbi:DUF6230 family protein [Nonomuraea sp. NPDC050404]|uniref:DUF6230 family protein n=1 Tax=Nonomuraea sp. NPDC050404 TaxID=3155783 RepID=UPI003409EE29